MQWDRSALLIAVDEAIEKNATVVALKTDVADLKVEVKKHGRLIEANTKAIGKLATEQHRMGVFMEAMGTDIKRMVEVLLPSKQREEQFDHFEAKVDQQEHRLAAVESTVKEHIRQHP